MRVTSYGLSLFRFFFYVVFRLVSTLMHSGFPFMMGEFRRKTKSMCEKME